MCREEEESMDTTRKGASIHVERERASIFENTIEKISTFWGINKIEIEIIFVLHQ
jgi:hypothetical protein